MYDELRKQLKLDEGCEYEPYRDHLGFWTIGIGHLIDPKRGGVWPELVNGRATEAQVEQWFAEDAAEAEAQLQKRLPWARTLDPARRGALINMTFQLGINGLLEFKRTLAAIQEGDYSRAALMMLQSLWAKQTPARAERMAEQMRTGEWQYAK